MASTPQSMTSFGAIQIKNAGTDGKYASVQHRIGRWITTILTNTVTNTVTVSLGQSVTYVKRGFYSIGNQYEYWSNTNRDAPPPSGHSLIDITVIGEIVG